MEGEAIYGPHTFSGESLEGWSDFAIERITIHERSGFDLPAGAYLHVKKTHDQTQSEDPLAEAPQGGEIGDEVFIPIDGFDEETVQKIFRYAQTVAAQSVVEFSEDVERYVDSLVPGKTLHGYKLATRRRSGTIPGFPTVKHLS